MDISTSTGTDEAVTGPSSIESSSIESSSIDSGVSGVLSLEQLSLADDETVLEFAGNETAPLESDAVFTDVLEVGATIESAI